MQVQTKLEILSNNLVMVMDLKPVLLISLFIGVMTFGMANAQLGLINGLLGLIHIEGTVFCSTNVPTLAVNSTAIPIFPNAQVELKCGGKAVSSATTNNAGTFSIMLDPLQFALSSLLTGCNLVVTTPLSTCNASLPSVGGLISSLQSVGGTIIGILNVVNIVPSGFKLLPST